MRPMKVCGWAESGQKSRDRIRLNSWRECQDRNADKSLKECLGQFVKSDDKPAEDQSQ